MATFAAVSVRADTVVIGGADDTHIDTNVKDATIYENAPGNSNGAGPAIFAGTDGTSLPLRGLIRFDIGDNLPAGAIVTGVQLDLYLGKFAGSGGAGSGPPVVDIELHRLSAAWGEGTTGLGMTNIGTTGQGFPANPGDATWSDAFATQTPWTAPGGDFSSTVSASTSVGTSLNALSSWDSTSALVADVQAWLDNPAQNFGWALVNHDELSSRTFRAFWTKEASDPTLRPELHVTFIPLPGDVNGDHVVNGLDIAQVASHWLTTGPSEPGDANADGVVNGLDIALIAAHWLQTGGGSGTAGTIVPEPSTFILSALALAGTLLHIVRRQSRHAQC